MRLLVRQLNTLKSSTYAHNHTHQTHPNIIQLPKIVSQYIRQFVGKSLIKRIAKPEEVVGERPPSATLIERLQSTHGLNRSRGNWRSDLALVGS